MEIMKDFTKHISLNSKVGILQEMDAEEMRKDSTGLQEELMI